MTSSPRAVLADLDDTLFDHAHATRAALGVLHGDVPAFQVWDRTELETRHGDVLERMHHEVLAGRVSIESARAERFRLLHDAALSDAGARSRTATDASTAATLARRYRETYESAWQPVAGAMELAATVKEAGLALVIVTNNITREQELKLERCGLDRFVDALVTSEDIGVTKPDPRIFTAALRAARVGVEDAVMLGDSWSTDVAGALAAGVRPVWLNRWSLPAPEHPRAGDVVELRALEPLENVWRALTRRA